ncbi:sensor histidine kinase [Mycoplasma sp. P36-A1]|uniref:sensor histidine kinase n=1 Tax=Mycoplasma sp. P36-A1 TaxID=3252900 RepID=UPI003C2F4D40
MIIVVNLVFLFVIISYYLRSRYIKKNEDDHQKFQRNLDEKDRILGDMVISLRSPAVMITFDKNVIAANTSFLKLHDEIDITQQTFLQTDKTIDDFVRGGHNSIRIDKIIDGKDYYVDLDKIGRNDEKAILISYHDVTSIKDLNRQQQYFISDLRHEVKTPLTAIIGLSDLIDSGRITDEKEIKKIIGTINSEANRINGLVDNLTTTMQTEIDIDKISLSKLFDELRFIYEAQETRIPVEFHNYVEIPLNSNYQLLKQIIINLVNNGIKYTKEGSVSVSAMRNNSKIKIAVVDTGVGISEEDKAKIFDRFYRVDKSRHRDSGGFGLGLSIVKNLIEKLHGNIEVESVEGKGSTFTIELPIKAADKLKNELNDNIENEKTKIEQDS